jgi:radical SAM superfamily enzyme YgiQ (UPF0313 family)
MQTDIAIVKPGRQQQLYGVLSGASLTGLEPPLWAALHASVLREHGYNVELFDAEIEDWSPEQTANHIQALNPILAVIMVSGTNPSASTMNMVGASLIIQCLKQIAPEIKVALAGLHPSALPQRTMIDELADFVCDGEGFITLPALLEAIKSKSPYHNVPGLWYRDYDAILSNPRPPLYNLKELPMPAWYMLPLSKYRAHNWHCFDNKYQRQPYAVIYTSLGCPFQCSFCCINAIFGKHTVRYRPIDSVIDEIEYLATAHDVRTIKIMDEMFGLSESRVVSLCNKIAERGHDLNFWAYARVDTVTAPMLKAMKKAGINWVAYGFESGSQKVLDSVTKGYKKEQLDRAIMMTKDAGIHIIGNYMFGLPDDDYESMQATHDMAVQLNHEFVNYNCVMAYPGSKLYDDAVVRGLPLPRTWEGYSQYGASTLPLPTRYLTGPEVTRFRDQAFNKYFSNPSYISMLQRTFGDHAVESITAMMSQRLTRSL